MLAASTTCGRAPQLEALSAGVTAEELAAHAIAGFEALRRELVERELDGDADADIVLLLDLRDVDGGLRQLLTPHWLTSLRLLREVVEILEAHYPGLLARAFGLRTSGWRCRGHRRLPSQCGSALRPLLSEASRALATVVEEEHELLPALERLAPAAVDGAFGRDAVAARLRWSLATERRPSHADLLAQGVLKATNNSYVVDVSAEEATLVALLRANLAAAARVSDVSDGEGSDGEASAETLPAPPSPLAISLRTRGVDPAAAAASAEDLEAEAEAAAAVAAAAEAAAEEASERLAEANAAATKARASVRPVSGPQTPFRLRERRQRRLSAAADSASSIAATVAVEADELSRRARASSAAAATAAAAAAAARAAAADAGGPPPPLPSPVVLSVAVGSRSHRRVAKTLHGAAERRRLHRTAARRRPTRRAWAAPRRRR